MSLFIISKRQLKLVTFALQIYLAEDYAMGNTEIIYVFVSKETIENRMNRRKINFKLSI